MSESVRWVVVGDTHNDHETIEMPDGDILLHVGDFCHFGNGLESFRSWLDDLDYDTKVIIAGNHGHPLERADDPYELFPSEDVRYLQDDATTLEGWTIYGSPWQPQFGQMSFNLPRGEPMAHRWSQIPMSTDILMTHGPPHRVLDQTKQTGRHGPYLEHQGCRELDYRVSTVRPHLHVFGHIHNQHGPETGRDVTFVNASYRGPGQAPYVVEMNEDGSCDVLDP